MQYLGDETLRNVASRGGFEAVPSEFIRIEVSEAEPTRYRTYHEPSFSGHDESESLERLKKFRTKRNNNPQPDEAGSLLCVLHRSRPKHNGGGLDKLPFNDADSTRCLFDLLSLPPAYLGLADGSLSLTHALIVRDQRRHVERFEFVAYCVTSQGDWSMALTHQRATMQTSVFWSLDQRRSSNLLVDHMQQLQDSACHPLLLPCIMFAAMLQSGLERKHIIKAHLRLLELKAQSVNRAASITSDAKYYTQEPPDTLEHPFELLQNCRREQASHEGKYELWRSYNEALTEGFRYCEELIAADATTSKFNHANSILRQWFEFTWKRLESLKARDIDHVERINHISDILYHVVHIRDSRIQLDIARASKRDSEDMKFITLLGAVFLPASLVASILNVQEFQFLPGAKLFCVYVAITIPLAGLLVTLLLTRPLWQRWYGSRRRRNLYT